MDENKVAIECREFAGNVWVITIAVALPVLVLLVLIVALWFRANLLGRKLKQLKVRGWQWPFPPCLCGR